MFTLWNKTVAVKGAQYICGRFMLAIPEGETN
jgi:hypothetical protein